MGNIMLYNKVAEILSEAGHLIVKHYITHFYLSYNVLS